MSARDKTSLGYGTQLNEMSNNSKTDSEISLSVFDVRSSDEENTPANDRFPKAYGFHDVTPHITGNFLTLRADISFANDEDDVFEVETVIPVKTNETQPVKTRVDKIGQTSQKQGIRFKKIKAYFVCKSTNHLIKDCNFHDKQSEEPKLKTVVNTGPRVDKPVWDNTKRVNHQKISKYPHLRKTFVPSGVLTRIGLITPIKQNEKKAFHTVSTVRPVSTARHVSTVIPFAPKIAQIGGATKPIYRRMDNVRPRGSYSPIKRSYYTKPAFRPKDLKQDVKTFGVQNMTTAGTRAVVNTGKGKMDTDLKKSRWVWRPKGNYLDHVSKDSGSFMLKKGNPEILLQDHAVVDSGCTSHMTSNKAYLSDYEDYNGGFVAFGSDPKGDELKFNLFSILQMCDKKNSILFTKTECLILSPSFKLLDKSQVVLRAPRKDDVYSLDLKNIVPSRGKSPSISFMRPFGCPLTILNTLDSLGKFDGKSDEGYFLRYSTSSKAFKIYNKRIKRVKENLHIDFLKDQPNVAGTGPNWMFNLDFLTNTMNYIPVSVENLVNMDAGTQDSYVAGSSGKDKGPTQEYILLPLHPHRTRIPVEDVAPAAHEKPSESSPKDNDVQDSEDVADKEGQHQMTEDEQVLHDELKKMIAQEVATSINKLSTGRSFVSTAAMRYVSAASTPIGANAGESSFVYLGGKIPIDTSTLPNADLPIDLNMPDLEDDSDALSDDGIFNRAYDDENVGAVADFNNMDDTINVSPIPILRIHKDHQKDQILGDPKSKVQTRGKIQKASLAQQSLNISQALQDESWVEAIQEELLQFKLQKLWILVDLPSGKKEIGTKWVFKNKRDERSIIVKNKATLVAQGFRQEEGIDYDDVFAPVARIEEIRTATTSIESNKPLVKDEDGEDVDVHVYRSMIDSLMYLTESRPGIMFAV
ncbi:putative ribonuclease H-like domain-containing protein, partial [Tanacetum coccineum]